MKGKYQLHPERGYVDITIEGRVTISELGEFIRTVWADSQWTPKYNGLIDFSAASIELSDQEVVDLSRAMRSDPRCSLGKWVFVVSRASDFRKLRILDKDEHQAMIRVFFDRPSAESRLDPRSPMEQPGPSDPSSAGLKERSGRRRPKRSNLGS